MAERATSEVVRLIGLFLLASSSAVAAPQQPAAETAALEAVSSATNAASCVAAAEDFVSKFPQSSSRTLVARLVDKQLQTIRHPEIGIKLLERANAIFTTPDELNSLQPVAVEIYAKANRIDEAFAVGSSLLSRKPDEFSTLSRLTSLGTEETRKKSLKHIDLSVQYGARAIEIIENNQRGKGVNDETWNDQRAPFQVCIDRSESLSSHRETQVKQKQMS